MFCSGCGYKLNDGVKFCEQCGSAQSNAPSPAGVYDDSFKFSVRPVFVKQLYMIRSLPILIFFLIWATGFFGGFSMIVIRALQIPVWVAFAWPPVVVILFTFFVFPYFIKKNIENTVYNFYGNRIEYIESYFNKAYKTINLSRVLCVNKTQGILQQRCGLGSICLDTAGMGHHAGVVLQDIMNSEKVCSKIQDLIKNNKPV